MMFSPFAMHIHEMFYSNERSKKEEKETAPQSFYWLCGLRAVW
jgi:hypothetical protein